MSEYWVSHKKYLCQYCNIFISDDAPSRQQHENGLRHQGNKDRFVRSLYKTGEKRKRDEDEEKREMARIDRAAQAAYAQDVGSGHAKASSSAAPAAVPASSSSSARKPPPPKPTNPYANYSTAQSLGYTDPDEERRKAEAAIRQTQGVAGEWQVVSSSSAQPSTANSMDETTGGDSANEARPRIDDDDDSRAFRLRKKTVTGLGELYDPGLVPIKLKVKKEEEEGERTGTDSVKKEEKGGWSSVQPEIKKEVPEVKTEPEEVGGESVARVDDSGSMFRKRRRKIT